MENISYYRETWARCCRAVCSLTFVNAAHRRIGSGTGFKVGDNLITNNHVYATPDAEWVHLRFVAENGYTESASKVMRFLEFQGRLLEGLPEDSWDYAILRLDDKDFQHIPSLQLGNGTSVAIGDEIAVLGFQFEQNNLSISQGVLSSRFIRAEVKYLQVDASINNGNSGGPLIDVRTNKVIGVITRKHTGLTNALDHLSQSLQSNIKLLDAQKGSQMIIGEIDILDSISVSQRQIQIAIKELARSANVGIGYAYETEKILECFE